MNYQDYWWPVRYGLQARRFLRKIASSYGSGSMFKIQRPLAVFLNTLLDDDHQETFKGTIHDKFKRGENSI